MAQDDIIADALKKAFSRDPWAVPGKDDGREAATPRSDKSWDKLVTKKCPSCGIGILHYSVTMTLAKAAAGDVPVHCYHGPHYSPARGTKLPPDGCGYSVFPAPVSP